MVSVPRSCFTHQYRRNGHYAEAENQKIRRQAVQADRHGKIQTQSCQQPSYSDQEEREAEAAFAPRRGSEEHRTGAASGGIAVRSVERGGRGRWFPGLRLFSWGG